MSGRPSVRRFSSTGSGTPLATRAAGLGVEREVAGLLDRADPQAVPIGAETVPRDPVLDLEDRLAVARECLVARGWVVRALSILETLLVDCEVEVRLQLRHLAQVVLQPHRQPVLVRDSG